MLDFHSEPDTPAEFTTGLPVAPRGYSLPRSVRHAIEYVHANLSEDLRLEDIAGAARLSTFHFARVFRKTMGMAPHRYVMRARVGKVKELLRDSDLSLVAIADEAGFSDQSHMSKVFKRLTGMTPKTFRSDRPLQTADRCFNSLELLRSKVQRLRVGHSVNQT
jgi:transcriptional regulator GlxA family with amidase domain